MRQAAMRAVGVRRGESAKTPRSPSFWRDRDIRLVLAITSIVVAAIGCAIWGKPSDPFLWLSLVVFAIGAVALARSEDWGDAPPPEPRSGKGLLEDLGLGSTWWEQILVSLFVIGFALFGILGFAIEIGLL